MTTITKNIRITTPKTTARQAAPIVRSGWKKAWIKLRVGWQMLRLAHELTGSWLLAVQNLFRIRQKYQAVFDEKLLSKICEVDGRYYWRLGTPGFPSAACEHMQRNEARRLALPQEGVGLRTIFIAITKQCPMRCEHCFEAASLNQADGLKLADMITLVHRYQDYGTTQIMLSGGEPLLRIKDIYEILDAARPGTDFWVISSGLGLSLERAQRLKAKGLTGIMISLDHFQPEQHDKFRGFTNAWNHAITAARNAQAAGLVLTLSLTATREFISEDNLRAYLKLARDLGASFVQLLEPAAIGAYQGKAVELRATDYKVLEQFYLTYNSAPQYSDYPIINYLHYHQRRVGCFGGGDRFFYIDNDGYAHLCPFCQGKKVNALAFPAADTVHLLQQFSCHDFTPVDETNMKIGK